MEDHSLLLLELEDSIDGHLMRDCRNCQVKAVGRCARNESGAGSFDAGACLLCDAAGFEGIYAFGSKAEHAMQHDVTQHDFGERTQYGNGCHGH